MKDKEIEAFESRHGYKPTPIRVAIDALAVYVHKDNPLNTTSLKLMPCFNYTPLRSRSDDGQMGQPGSNRRLG